MLKKILVQIFLTIIIITILISFYFKYINKNDQTKEKEIVELEITNGNIMTNISYESQDFEGRRYLIKSKKGIVNKDNSNIIKMETVEAKIVLLDGSIVKIVSDYAEYDYIIFDTKFNGNVKVNHLDHLVKSEDLVLSLEKEQLEAFNNLTYENLDLIMYADKIIFDFNTKNIKTFNFDNSNIKIQNK